MGAMKELAQAILETELVVTINDVCYADYLTNHHNRPGERLIGVDACGLEARVLADYTVEELNSADYGMPEEITDDMLKVYICAYLEGCERFTATERCCDASEDCHHEQPMVWVLITFRADLDKERA